MCKPYLLRVEYTSDSPMYPQTYAEYDGEGQAEEAGIAKLESDDTAISFTVFALTGRFKRVTKIERVPIKPQERV